MIITLNTFSEKLIAKMGFEKVILKAGASGKRAVKGNSVTVHCTGMFFNLLKSNIISANKKSLSLSDAR